MRFVADACTEFVHIMRITQRYRIKNLHISRTAKFQIHREIKPLKDSNYLRTDGEGNISCHIPGKGLTSNRIQGKYLQLNGNSLHTFCVCVCMKLCVFVFVNCTNIKFHNNNNNNNNNNNTLSRIPHLNSLTLHSIHKIHAPIHLRFRLILCVLTEERKMKN